MVFSLGRSAYYCQPSQPGHKWAPSQSLRSAHGKCNDRHTGLYVKPTLPGKKYFLKDMAAWIDYGAANKDYLLKALN